MNPIAIFDPQKRGRFAARIAKACRQVFSAPVSATPVFVLGIQRSGTTMLMFAFHQHPDIAVYDESRASKAFLDFRLRSLENSKKLITSSCFPFICFKPLADSHLANQLFAAFPCARVIWALRDYSDVANSFLRKFPHATRAIRLVCSGQDGGGWFQEGISGETGHILRGLPWRNFSDYDFACLVWWARNRLFFEQKLNEDSRVMLLRYEKLVTEPVSSLSFVSQFVGAPFSERMTRYIHSRSIARHQRPKIADSVRDLCEKLSGDFKYFAEGDLSRGRVL